MQRLVRIWQVHIEFVLALHARIQSAAQGKLMLLTRQPETRINTLRINELLARIACADKDKFQTAFVHRSSKTYVVQHKVCLELLPCFRRGSYDSFLKYQTITKSMKDGIHRAVATPHTRYFFAVVAVEIRPMVFSHLLQGVITARVRHFLLTGLTAHDGIFGILSPEIALFVSAKVSTYVIRGRYKAVVVSAYTGFYRWLVRFFSSQR